MCGFASASWRQNTSPRARNRVLIVAKRVRVRMDGRAGRRRRTGIVVEVEKGGGGKRARGV